MTMRLTTGSKGAKQRRRRLSPARLLAVVLLSVAQIQTAAAAIVNEAVASASYGAATVDSAPAAASVPVAAGNAVLSVSKSGTLNDDDGTPGQSAGDTVDYVITAENTGDVSLTNVVADDPMVTLIFDAASDSDGDGAIDPGETWRWTASYALTQSDIDSNGGGDGYLDNTVTITTDQLAGQTADESILLDFSPAMTVAKSGVLNDDDGIAGISAGDTITYTVTVENTGNVTLTNALPSDPMAPMTYVSGDTDANGEFNAGEIWEFTGNYALTQADIDSNGGGDGNIENTVTVDPDQLAAQTADALVPLDIAPEVELAKTGTLNDDDGTPGLSAGDTITFEVSAENTGNIRFTNPVFSDPLITLNLQSGDANNDGILDVGEVWTLTGTYIVTQSDLDGLGGGDSDIDNTVTLSSDQMANQTAVAEVPLPINRDLEVTKVATAPVQLFPTIHEFDYQLTVRNTGNVTQTNIRIEDDLVAALSPATLVQAPSVVVSGFSGTGGYNAGYDGDGDTQLLTGDVQLAPGGIALITISLRIDTGAQTIDSVNTAFADSSELPAPVPSDDPNVTVDNSNDFNPTPVVLPDADGDGSPDAKEDPGDDRDGDGINNADDYDPTGYFYCQADGRILTGGLITVQNLTSGGSQTGIGASNGIVILRDGSDGRYQFHATEPGEFLLSYILPPEGVASTTLTSSGALDVSSLLPDDPAVLGSGEDASTGFLVDPDPASNPFYTRFAIEAGDPAVFNNNIPLQYCGTPELTSSKTLISGPDVQADGRFRVSYDLSITASGNEPVENAQMVDDLAAVFGSGNFSIINQTLNSAPGGVALDPFYDGETNVALLVAGSTLQPGETVRKTLVVDVAAAAGVYDNTLVANGTSPFDGSALPPSVDNAEVVIPVTSDRVVVEKTALPGRARLGSPVAYTITATNRSGFDIADLDVIDRIPNGMSYVAGSAQVDGVPVEPEQVLAAGSGAELAWRGLALANGDSVTVTLTLILNASAKGPEFINRAHAEDGVTGGLLSNVATALVELEIEPVFQCSDLIGRVFDDLDRDGYHDDGEPGLPGVRLVTPRGLLITTDQFGRYHLACGAVPDADIGSNFILKLDPRSLPTGYRLTSENPRVVRLTRGKLTKLNFAAANLRVVRLELTAEAFAGDNRLSRETLRSLGQIVGTLDDEPSVLKLVYSAGPADAALARQRLEATRELVERAWAARQRTHELTIEMRTEEASQ